MPVQDGLANQGLGANSSPPSAFVNKVLLGRAIPTRLHIVPGRFCVTTAEVSGVTKTIQPTRPKIFTI